MKSKLLLVSALTLAGFALVAAPRDAAAVAICVSPEWTATAPTEASVPPTGPLVIPAELADPNGFGAGLDEATALDFVSVVVTDPNAVEVAGSIAYDTSLRAVLWSPTDPLDATTAYTASVVFDNVAMQAMYGGCGLTPMNLELSIALAATVTDPSATAPTNVAATLGETEVPVSQCCTTDFCTTRGCDYCWITEYQYVPTLTVTWDASDLSADALEYTIYNVYRQAPDATDRFLVGTYPARSGPFTVDAVFTEGAGYCVEVEAIDIATGTRAAAAPVCVSESELMSLPRQTPPAPDLTQCSGDFVLESDGDTAPDATDGDATGPGTDVTGGDGSSQADDDGVIGSSSEESCSCRIRRDGDGSPAPLGLAAALLGLGAFLVRRRGAAKR